MTVHSRSRIVRCCHCKGMMRVSARALSVFCPHCQKRASLESLRIIGSHPGKALATCGDIFIEATANLNLAVYANNVLILGCIRGPVFANETVEVGPSARVFGDIKACKIIVRDGALIEGRCVMTPPVSPQPDAGQPPAHGDDPHTTDETETTDEPETPDKPETPNTATEPPLTAPRPITRPSPLPPPPGRIKPQRLD